MQSRKRLAARAAARCGVIMGLVVLGWGASRAGAAPEAAQIAMGQRIFRGEEAGGTCAACHGQDGEGTPMGPALSGKPQWSDGSAKAIAGVIAKGVDQPKNFAAPMPPMGGGTLTPEQIDAVAAYVVSLSAGK